MVQASDALLETLTQGYRCSNGHAFLAASHHCHRGTPAARLPDGSLRPLATRRRRLYHRSRRQARSLAFPVTVIASAHGSRFLSD